MIENLFIGLVVAVGAGTAAFAVLVVYKLFKTRA